VSLFILGAGCADNGKENEEKKNEDEVISLVSLKDTKCIGNNWRQDR
jgi:hypothetical protein